MSDDNLLNTVSGFAEGDDAEEVYDRWAVSYDTDLVTTFGYNSPALVAGAVAGMMHDLTAPIIDHACGTGLSGLALQEAGFTTIDGTDVSAQMLVEAEEKAVYRSLQRADLTEPGVALPAAPYAAMTLVGAVAPGHLEPEDLPALMTTVDVGAPVVIYFNAAYDTSHDYLARIARLSDDGAWTVERRERTNYMDALDRPGWLIAARRGR